MVPTESDRDAVHIRRPYPNENAFPYVVTGLDEFTAHPGLTKREFFAAMAMQGLVLCEGVVLPNAAQEAVNAADALIEALQPQR